MDDEEYYEKMRNHNLNKIKISHLTKKSKYSTWKINQGREDAEMLQEKNSLTEFEKNNFELEDN